MTNLVHEKVETIELRYNSEKGVLVAQQKSEPFLRGPIPIAWLKRAAQLPGKTINVGLAIHWIVGMSANTTIKLNRSALANFNISADAASDALRRLEADGLVKLHKQPGRRPLIEVLSQHHKNAQGEYISRSEAVK